MTQATLQAVSEFMPVAERGKWRQQDLLLSGAEQKKMQRRTGLKKKHVNKGWLKKRLPGRQRRPDSRWDRHMAHQSCTYGIGATVIRYPVCSAHNSLNTRSSLAIWQRMRLAAVSALLALRHPRHMHKDVEMYQAALQPFI